MIARLVGQRLVQAALVLWLAATLAFFALHLAPGDPAQALLAASGATQAEIAERRAALGLDDPPMVQYGRYLGDLVQGKLGRSWLHGRAVTRVIWEQIPPTITLALAAMGVGVALGTLLGASAALRQGTWLDGLLTVLTVVSISTPTYWSGIVAILLFSLHWPHLPATGEGSLQHLILPALVLGFALAGSIARTMRAHVVEVLGQPYVLAARARGLGLRQLLKHVLRPALPPVLTVTGLQFGFLLGGAVVTETVFSRRGLGRMAVEAITMRDLPVVRGLVVFGALIYVLVNLAADLAQIWLTPRLREELP